MNAHSDPEAQHPEAESSGSRRSGQNPSSPAVVGQIAFVEEEKRSSYFHWETYQSHKKGARPSLEEAKEAAIEALKEEGQL